MTEREIMQRLGAALAQPNVAASLDQTADELLAELREDPAQAKSTFRAIPLELYGPGLPPDIRSAWVFALRKGFAHPPERHPNSIQRMFALKSSGRFEVWDGARWVTHTLDPGDAGLSIPVDAWHRSPALDEDWAVASFHTCEPSDLLEIVGDPESGKVGSTRVYLADS
jgi:hypothetical protein